MERPDLAAPLAGESEDSVTALGPGVDLCPAASRVKLGRAGVGAPGEEQGEEDETGYGHTDSGVAEPERYGAAGGHP